MRWKSSWPPACRIPRLRLPYITIEELIAWARENRRADILAQFGIYLSFGI
ncbi:MAG: hypothetical protein WAM52_18635 [Steroidobacteraceae bacterium]